MHTQFEAYLIRWRIFSRISKMDSGWKKWMNWKNKKGLVKLSPNVSSYAVVKHTPQLHNQRMLNVKLCIFLKKTCFLGVGNPVLCPLPLLAFFSMWYLLPLLLRQKRRRRRPSIVIQNLTHLQQQPRFRSPHLSSLSRKKKEKSMFHEGKRSTRFCSKNSSVPAVFVFFLSFFFLLGGGKWGEIGCFDGF